MDLFVTNSEGVALGAAKLELLGAPMSTLMSCGNTISYAFKLSLSGKSDEFTIYAVYEGSCPDDKLSTLKAVSVLSADAEATTALEVNGDFFDVACMNSELEGDVCGSCSLKFSIGDLYFSTDSSASEGMILG